MTDLRFALRQLSRRRAFTVPAVLILAAGLGLNTALFSFVDGLLMRPLPLPGLSRLVTLGSVPVDRPAERGPVTAGDFADWSEQARSFSGIAAWQGVSSGMQGDGGLERIEGARVSPEFFAVLGLRPLSGRLFGEELKLAADREVVVVSEGFWRRRLGGSPTTVGTALRLDGRSYTVVGVMPSRVAYPVAAEFWIPLTLTPAQRVDRASRNFEVIARLGRGVSAEGAQAELTLLASRQATQFPLTHLGRTARLVSLREHLLANSEVPHYLPVVVLASLFLLLLACANVANLMVAEIHGRTQELAVRAALGATRGRLVRQILTDSVVICVLGALAGLPVARAAIGLIRASLPADLLPYVPGWSAVGLNPVVYGYALFAALVTGVLAGLAPVLAVPLHALESVVRQGGRGLVSGRRSRLRQGLVVVEVGLSLVLLVACGLVVKTFAGLVLRPTGFEAREVLTLRISLPVEKYATPGQISAFHEAALQEVRGLPGVRAAGLTSTLPFYGRDEQAFAPKATPPKELRELPQGGVQVVDAGYFEALRIPLLRGRAFDRHDRAGGQLVAIVSDGVANRCWPGEDPLGKQIWLPGSDPGAPRAVAGVVGDVHDDWRGPAALTVYLPFDQQPASSVFLSVRTDGNPVHQVRAVRAAVRRVEDNPAFTRVKPLRQVVIESMAGLYITAGILTVLGITAALLAGAGVYSVLANSVAQRRRELGVRAALGASPRRLAGMVMREATSLCLLGVAVGLPAALGASRMLGYFLHGIVSPDPWWMLWLTSMLLVTAMVAAWLPSRKAGRIDPLIALRCD